MAKKSKKPLAALGDALGDLRDKAVDHANDLGDSASKMAKSVGDSAGKIYDDGAKKVQGGYAASKDWVEDKGAEAKKIGAEAIDRLKDVGKN